MSKKLTPEDYAEIHTLKRHGVSVKDIVEIFKERGIAVTRRHVNKILRGNVANLFYSYPHQKRKKHS